MRASIATTFLWSKRMFITQRLAQPALAPLYGQMLAKLQALPGVVSASQCWMTPLSGNEWSLDVKVPGYQPPSGC